MSLRVAVPLPDARAREAILRVLLRGEHVDGDLAFDLIASWTDGFSGSDLKELVRVAALVPVWEAYQAERALSEGGRAERAGKRVEHPPIRVAPRAICKADFEEALRSVAPTGHAAAAYRISEEGGGGSVGKAIAISGGAAPSGGSPGENVSGTQSRGKSIAIAGLLDAAV